MAQVGVLLVDLDPDQGWLTASARPSRGTPIDLRLAGSPAQALEAIGWGTSRPSS